MSVAYEPGYLGWMFHLLFETIHIDIIVPQTMHFCKSHTNTLLYDYSSYSAMMLSTIWAVSTIFVPLSILLFCRYLWASASDMLLRAISSSFA